MRLYDTARGEVVPFEPGEVVTMYTCGITPYDATHIGHAAVYIAYDVLQRRLRDRGHDTKCVRNITDVDDSILQKAREIGVHYLDLAASEVAKFDDDMEAALTAARPLLEKELQERLEWGLAEIFGLDHGSAACGKFLMELSDAGRVGGGPDNGYRCDKCKARDAFWRVLSETPK